MPWQIAPVAEADVEEVARVHVTVWQQAYAGLMSADYLASLDPVAFAERWHARVRNPLPGRGDWLARDAEGVVGLVSSGPSRDEDPPTPLELYAINTLARAHGSGLADALMEVAIADRPASLWVLAGNDRAAGFYRRHGFTDEGGRKPEPHTEVTEIRMARGLEPR